MNPLKVYEGINRAARDFGRAVIVGAVLAFVVLVTKGVRVPNNASMWGDAVGFLNETTTALIRAGVPVKAYQLAILLFVLYLVVFDAVVSVCFRLAPKLVYSHASFWRAHKSWKEPREIALHSSLLPDEVNPSSVERQLALLENRYKGTYADTYQSSVGWIQRRTATRSRYYAGIWTALVVLGLLVIVGLFQRHSVLSPARLALAGGILIIIAVCIRIAWESAVEKECLARTQFVLSCFAQEERTWSRSAEDVERLELTLYAQLVGSPAPAFPYGRIWLLHLIRQMPLCDRLGAYAWRSASAFDVEQPGVVHSWRKLYPTDPRSQTLPSGALQRSIAQLAIWLHYRGWSLNEALMGGAVDYKNVGEQLEAKYWKQRVHT